MSNTLHVEPREDRWVIRREGARFPLSEHDDAGAATRAARAAGAQQVLVRDRYHRVHRLAPPAAGRRGAP
jgi:hypothetical protein